MPWDFEIDPAQRLIRIRVQGTLRDRDLLGVDAALRNHCEFDPSFNSLIDLREAIGGEVTAAGVQVLAQQPPLLAPNSRSALVVPTDLGFGMARMFELLREGKPGEVRAFKDLDGAREWLDLD
jgi:hypothetical protein